MLKRIVIFTVVILGVLFFISQNSQDIINDGVVSINSSQETGTNNAVKENGGYKTLTTNDIDGVSRQFDFSFSIFEDWRVGPLSASRALNIYNPTSGSDGSLEQSQIFVTFFTANNFQTLKSVNILSREEHFLNERPAVTYIIRKKDGVADFVSQPSWRNLTHKITDVRLRDENPSTFYVFAKNPELSEAEFQRFLNSLEF